MTYYWYNYRPLSCCADEVGFVVLLGLLIWTLQATFQKACRLIGKPFSTLTPTPLWILLRVGCIHPSINISGSWKKLTSTFATTGSVVAALSSYDD
ncbi:SUPPRESSOR OF RPS4-RLD 1, SUPPRESSOR OF RPS4-RLD 3 [Hibiscus trionum]|uniref:SUPPRESSOR OF RPS4-RLD 1, SUPPRESSOR OF RPS4-RLD 3 n=1 Tax=Hibiscus trionum TaxID=183268 RepID=A0A9W7LVU6_HIBTR|nr:SUPPRESSOR OF RPS4-RLD 1, SUPPRESSOR OF RPS4-RLD 3 [Hibiscus trionum]